MRMALKVSEVARLAGVSVRALHHYDEIGLVRPSARSAAGYRLYSPADLERLQQVLFFRELDFPLEEIQRMLSDPDFDVAAALRMQRQLLTERAVRIKALIAAVEATIDSLEKGTTMTDEERFEVFGNFDPSKYQDEVKEKWGNTEEYRESAKRTKKYTKDDWVRIKAEEDSIFRDLAKLLDAGVLPTAADAMEVAERHRVHIDRWFYRCPRSMHAGIGELYVSDRRFSDSIDRFAPGLAQYARGAWRANAERKGA
jgi:DNA-binding transcriptional MerR regulator